MNNNKTLVLLCEHASSHIPPEFKNLGLPRSVVESHIGYDPGSIDLAEYIARHFECKLFSGSTSRLLIDLNRSFEDKDIIPKSRWNITIPLNVNIENDEKEKRYTYYNQFHQGVKTYLEKLSMEGKEPIILSIHSFSPEFIASFEQSTAVDCGLLFNEDERLADSFYKIFQNTEFNVKKNQPYNLKEYKTGGVIEHGEKNHYPYLGLELPYPLLIQQAWREMIGVTIIQSIEYFLAHS
jgi:predicted N-formylglutamate amidohydrolase